MNTVVGLYFAAGLVLWIESVASQTKPILAWPEIHLLADKVGTNFAMFVIVLGMMIALPFYLTAWPIFLVRKWVRS